MEDADDMFANWVTDAEVIRFWDWKPHQDIAETESLLRSWINEYEKDDYYHWVIICKKNMQAIGYIYLDSIDNSKCSGAVHYLLSKVYWNQGIMSEACKRIIEYAFQEVGLNRIYSYHHSDNLASGRVMQKCEMTLYKTEYKEMGSSWLSGKYCYYEIEKEY